MNPAVERAARLLSWALHPVFMPLITLFIAFNVDPDISYFLSDDLRRINYLLVFVMTVAFPLASILLMKRGGIISEITLPTATERIFPFTSTFFYYGLTYFLLRQAPIHPAVHSMLLGATLALLCTIVITFFHKISVHMVGMGGLVGAVVGLAIVHQLNVLTLIAVLAIVLGALGSARLVLGAHRPSEIYTGALVGGLCVFVPIVLHVRL